MWSRVEIEEILKAEFDLAKSRYESARAEVAQVGNEVPSELPLERIENASRDETAARQAFTAALQRFNDFILRGEIPDDLSERE